MSHSNDSVQAALDNLEAIQSGEDPRTRESEVTVDELSSWEDARNDRHATCYSRTREEVHGGFVHLLNLIEPDHPYHDSDVYPANTTDVKFSYHTESSNTIASCGPKRSRFTPFMFSVDMSTFESARPSFLFVVLAHEVAHIEHGSHSESCGHRPVFWDRMADMVVDVLEHRHSLVAGDLPSGFEQRVVEQAVWDVNYSNVDRRSVTVDEQREIVLDRIRDGCRRRDLDVSVSAEYRNA